MLGNAGPTEFDLRFLLFGIPIRVHPLFWLMAGFVVWRSERLDLVFIGMLCVFVSILIHELGHAVMFRRYGFRGEIVLYLMGGYATGGALSTWRNVIVSAAGPVAGFLLYGLVRFVEISIPVESTVRAEGLGWSILVLRFVNGWWGIINLLPCLPLDGGRIMESLVHRYWPRRGIVKVLWISIFFSGAVALWGVTHHERFLIVLFGILCAQHVIALNQHNTYR